MTQEVKLKASTYFKIRWKAFDYKRGWLKSNCPICGAEFKFGINLDSNTCHCFKCSYLNQVVSTVKEIENLSSYSEAIRLILGYNEDSIAFTPSVKKVTPITQILPDGFRIIGDEDSEVGKIFLRYVKKRGVNLTTAEKFKLGYVGDPVSKYFGYLILPVLSPVFPYSPVYFQTRRVFGTGPKFKNPTHEELGVGKVSLLYNEVALKRFKSIFIVESIFNALTLGERAIALFGKSIHEIQLSKLITSNVEEFIIIEDPDAYKEALKLAMKLVFRFKVKVVRLPDGEDVNSFGKINTLKIVEETPHLKYSDLLIKKVML